MDKVVVIFKENLPDGTYRDANSDEVSIDEAVQLVESGQARIEGYSYGVLPEAVEPKKVKQKKGFKGAVVEDGEHIG